MTDQQTTSDTSTPATASTDATEPVTEATESTEQSADAGDAQPTEQTDADDSGAGGGTTDAPKVSEAKVTLGELQALADEAGLKIQEEPDNRERSARRAHEKRESEALQADISAANAQIDRYMAEHDAEISMARQLFEAMEAGNLDGIAKACGHESWESLQLDARAALNDPHRREFREWQRQQEAREQQAIQAEQEQRARQEQQARAAQAQQHRATVAQALGTSQDRVCSALSDVGLFVRDMAIVHRRHGGTTVEELLSKQLPNGQTVMQRWRGVYERIRRAEAASAPKQTTAAPKATSRAPGKTQVVKGSPVEAAGAAEWTDEKEFTRRWIKTMEEAAARDRFDRKPLGG